MNDGIGRRGVMGQKHKTTPTNFAGTVWHYTVGDCIEGIIQDGVIRQSGLGELKRIKPVVWFSKNQFWEATAGKKNPANLDLQLKTIQENADARKGVYRIGTTLQKTPMLHWSALGRAAKFTDNGIRNMEESGREVGADPDDWYGSFKAVGVDDWTAIEVFKEGKWVGFTGDEFGPSSESGDDEKSEKQSDEITEIEKTVHKIIQPENRGLPQIKAIMLAVSPATRAGVADTFKTNERLRHLFPEYVDIFDKNDFSGSKTES